MLITKHSKRPQSKYSIWYGDLFFTRTYKYLISESKLFENEKQLEDWVCKNILKDYYRQCFLLSVCHPAVRQMDIKGLYVIRDEIYRSMRADIFVPSTGTVIELKHTQNIKGGFIDNLENQMSLYSRCIGVKQVFGLIFQKTPPTFVSGRLIAGKWNEMFEVYA